MRRLNGVVLGPESPYLRRSAAVRLVPNEEDMCKNLVELLVGRPQKDKPRQRDHGMMTRWPELMLLYHIPNSAAGRSRGMAGRMKAMGVLRGMCDYCLPVARGPFHSLYVEMKMPGERSRADQVDVQRQLRQEGHCVMEAHSVEEAAQIILGYLALPQNRVSARPVPRDIQNSTPTIEDRITKWRQLCYVTLKPIGRQP